jgi:FKBP-type peptidyl-prolyl cis-trans isomerase 2
MGVTTGDSVVVEYTGRLDDGSVFDTSRESVAQEANLVESQPEREFQPLTVEIGKGRIIDGLEEALVGLDTGETETVTIPPEKGYGEWSDERVTEYDREEFSQMVDGKTPEAGDHLQTQDGGLAEITHVGDDVVNVDFNHSLAGETLEFDVEIVDVN